MKKLNKVSRKAILFVMIAVMLLGINVATVSAGTITPWHDAVYPNHKSNNFLVRDNSTIHLNLNILNKVTRDDLPLTVQLRRVSDNSLVKSIYFDNPGNYNYDFYVESGGTFYMYFISRSLSSYKLYYTITF